MKRINENVELYFNKIMLEPSQQKNISYEAELPPDISETNDKKINEKAGFSK